MTIKLRGNMQTAALIATGVIAGNSKWPVYTNPIYVTKAGNDTTGNGTKAAPYVTINKAYSVATAGSTVVVGDGVYAENSGAGCLSLTRTALADYITIAAERGRYGDVTITNASGSSTIMIAAKYVRFQWIKFVGASGTSTAWRINGASSYIDVQDCTITPADNATAGIYIVSSNATVQLVTFTRVTVNRPAAGATCDGVQIHESSTADLKNITFTNCTIGAKRYGISLLRTGAGIAVDNCTINADGIGITVTSGAIDALATSGTSVTSTGAEAVKVPACTAMTLTNNTYENNAANTTVLLGVDGEAGGGPLTVTMTGGTVRHSTSLAGHGVLLGNGVTNSLVDGLTVSQCYDHAIVVKENSTNEVRNCDLTGGAGTDSATCVYVKGATGANVHNNTFRASRGYGFQAWNGDTGNKIQNVTCTYANMYLTGSAAALTWVGDAGDAGGGVCDYNTYRLQGTGKLGVVRSDSDVQNITELRAAWSGYGDGTNDSHSTVS